MKEKIHLIMPMAGGGTRFGNKGFGVPKPLIELQGKPFFYWATQSVLKFVEVQDVTFVVLKEHVNKFSIDKKILEYFPNAHICVIPHVLNGAVLTCREGVMHIVDSLPILFNDCDHAFVCNSFYEYCREANFEKLDGALLTFFSNNPAYSYVQLNQEKNVIKTIEKEVISNEAICGAYYFKNRETFLEATNAYLTKCEYKEFFVSGLYNEIANRGACVKTFQIDEHMSFGTPEEYDAMIDDERMGVLI